MSGLPGLATPEQRRKLPILVCCELPDDGECLCDGAGTVRMSNGRLTLTYTVPCPQCRTDEFYAEDIDTDHYVMRPCRKCGRTTVDA